MDCYYIYIKEFLNILYILYEDSFIPSYTCVAENAGPANSNIIVIKVGPAKPH